MAIILKLILDSATGASLVHPLFLGYRIWFENSEQHSIAWSKKNMVALVITGAEILPSYTGIIS